jgi:dihydrofolate synthase/folylpolyglutamate synthase
LFTRTKGQILPGLDRVAAAYAKLGRPLESTPTILVGGTNGKGTTCAFLAMILRHAGLRVALYTSPHLRHYRERLWLDGAHPTPSAYAESLLALKNRLGAELFEQLSFFEIFTLIASLMIESSRSDVAILEVGMGGRWDATNITSPVISAVTGVALDHQQYLGSDVASIALEKVQIARKDRPFFWGRGGEIPDCPDAEQMALAELRRIGCDLRVRDGGFGFAANQIWCANGAIDQWPVPESRAWPTFLLQNLSLAAAIAVTFKPNLKGQLSSILDQLTPTDPAWPEGQRGRFELRTERLGERRQLVLLDVCHNVDGARALTESLKKDFQGARLKRLPGMVSILSDKDFDKILDILQTVLEPIVLFGCNSPRSWRRENLADHHKSLEFVSDFTSAWRRMSELNPLPQEPVVICGSVAGIGDVLQFFVDDRALP